ncbi:MAG: glycosyltransferase family 4 protein [Gemmataceae bacterium]|nr:glycosyltransferase family 4 protein [Gemmataceae bacterium]
MRIAYLCADAGVPVFGTKGCSAHVREVIRVMRRAGHAVEVFSPRVGGQRPGDLTDLPCHAIEAGNPETVNRTLTDAIRSQGRFDAVYERYSLWSHAGLELAREAGIPAALEVNSPLIDEQIQHRGPVDTGLAARMTRRAMTAASTVFAVSDEVAKYVSRYREDTGSVEVLPNGVDVTRFSPPAASQKGSFVTVGFVGTLKPWHGVAHLVAAFDQLCRNRPVRLLVVGDGPQRAAIAAEIERRGIASFVEMPGAVDHEQVPDFIRRMDIAVAPYPVTDFYFSPLKLYEYMAAGRAVVASRVGQIAQTVRHGETGLLCEAGDESALAEAIGRLVDDAELRARLGSAARAMAVDSHSWKSVGDRILARLGGRAA